MEVDHSQARRPVRVSFGAVVTQIVLLDLVFSIDSVITAVGMARALSIMVAAVVIAVLVMLAFAALDQQIRRASPQPEDPRPVLPAS